MWKVTTETEYGDKGDNCDKGDNWPMSSLRKDRLLLFSTLTMSGRTWSTFFSRKSCSLINIHNETKEVTLYKFIYILSDFKEQKFSSQYIQIKDNNTYNNKFLPWFDIWLFQHNAKLQRPLLWHLALGSMFCLCDGG